VATLTVEGLSRTFAGGGFALRNASFSVPHGHLAAVVGPPGAGKTTLLRLIAGLMAADEGSVLLDGNIITSVAPHRRRIGLVFDEPVLFPHLDVRENVAFGLRIAKWQRQERRERVAETLALVGLEEHAERPVDELAVEQRRRVALARALAPRPAVLLLDAPLAAVDEEEKQWLRAELRNLLQASGTTALLATRDARDAIAIADDLVMLVDGLVLQSGALADVVGYPATAEVAARLGYVTLIHGEAADSAVTEPAVGAIEIPEGAPVRGRTRVMAHPSGLLAVPAGRGLGCGLRGIVFGSRPDGPLWSLDVALGSRHIVVRWEWDVAAPPAGTLVDLAVRPETLRFYGARVPARAAATAEDLDPAMTDDAAPSPGARDDAVDTHDEASGDPVEGVLDADLEASRPHEGAQSRREPIE
jgi:putative spermidine/putrescine transport system ATP-binding protein